MSNRNSLPIQAVILAGLSGATSAPGYLLLHPMSLPRDPLTEDGLFNPCL